MRDKYAQLAWSRHLQSLHGTQRAAMYLQAKGWPVEAAVWVLCRRGT